MPAVSGLSAEMQKNDKDQKPNIVVIMADDLGYGDLGYTGAPDIRTPNIDGIAASGTEYTNYYASAATSTPTRCAFMTGRYQARFQNLEEALYMGVDHIGLPKGEETIARVLQRGGYKTGLIGKWHLGSIPELRPLNYGFDHFEGFLSGNIDYFTHCEKNRRADLYSAKKAIKDKRYMTDYVADQSIEFIKKNKEKPFFLFVAFNMPHWPYQGPDDGPCAVDGHDWMEGSRQKLVSMIEYADKRVGDILMALAQCGLDENTIVIFTSDNGGDKYARNYPFRGFKGQVYDGGIHVPLAMRWTGVISPGQKCDCPVITMDLSATIASMAGCSFNVPIDGISFYPSTDSSSFKDRPLVWRNGMRKQYAVRKDKYKLVYDKGTFFLFDLINDPSEQKDISVSHKDIVRELQDIYEGWEVSMPYKQTQFGQQLMLHQSKK